MHVVLDTFFLSGGEKLLGNGHDQSVTLCTAMQQPKGGLLQNRVLSYNAARS